MFTYIRYVLNNVYNCCFTEHSKVTAHNRDGQISYMRETAGVSGKAPQGSELGDRRQLTWFGSQHRQSLKASPLQNQKDTTQSECALSELVRLISSDVKISKQVSRRTIFLGNGIIVLIMLVYQCF